MDMPKVIISIAFVFLLFALLIAIIKFLKTPKEIRYTIFTEDKNAQDPNYAPEYTKQERINFLIKYGSLYLLLFLIMKYYFFPWLKEYSSHANCYFYFGEMINGIHIVFYGVFVILPLLLAITLILFEGKRAIAIIKKGQNPLPDEKVFRPTKYKYGLSAKIQPIILIIIIILLVFLSIWGSVQAHKFTQTIKPCDDMTINVKESN